MKTKAELDNWLANAKRGARQLLAHCTSATTRRVYRRKKEWVQPLG